MKIAIGGKGGVGKTTVCAVWAQLFAEDGFDVLAIDADPSTSLASAFGIPSEQSPQPLIEMKQLIAERTGTEKGSVGAYFKLNPKVSDLPEKYWLEVGATKDDGRGMRDEGRRTRDEGRLKLLVLGSITQAGAGCACPEATFLKALLTHTILQRQEVVLVDLAAGVEFMGRASVQGIDALIVVVEPGARSIETASNIARMAEKLGIKHIAAVMNKITEAGQVETIRSKLTNIPVLANIAYNPAVQQADLASQPVIKADAGLVEELAKAKKRLIELIGQASGTNSVKNNEAQRCGRADIDGRARSI
jgi:CO dehydrogenase maturation factor